MQSVVPAREREGLIDLIKAVGCLLIVAHHLAFYGPMSDVVMRVWPDLIEWLFDHGRLAVQLFLVCAGYLTAVNLAKLDTINGPLLLRLLVSRYFRLAIPLLAALSVTVLVTEWVRPDFDHSSLSSVPTWDQALAHIFFLQHLLDMEALSAGIWYVAIDFQLYLVALLAVAMAKWAHLRWPHVTFDIWRRQVWWVLTAASLWWWNLQADLDDYGVYFLGAYGLGWLAHHVRQNRQQTRAWLALIALGGVAWWLDPRSRLVVAWAAAIGLALGPLLGFKGAQGLQTTWRRAVQWLSKVSYAVFVIHFSVSLAVNAGVTFFWPTQILPNALGMLASMGLSLWAGGLLFKQVEHPPATFKRWLSWSGVFMSSVALAMLIN
jgi:peptidoglycan/LPS O-acetylase OafA/YrhL